MRAIVCAALIALFLSACQESPPVPFVVVQETNQPTMGDPCEGYAASVMREVARTCDGVSVRVYVCSESSNYVAKLLRYFLYPTHVGDAPSDATAATHAEHVGASTLAAQAPRHRLSSVHLDNADAAADRLSRARMWASRYLR